MKRSELKLTALASSVALLALVSACGGLSDREKKMVGDYYESVLSDNIPIYELREDRSATIRKIDNGIVVSVDGVWKVKDDSLIIDTDKTTLRVDDDDVDVSVACAPHVARYIISYNDITLSLRDSDGFQHDYHRRYHRNDND